MHWERSGMCKEYNNFTAKKKKKAQTQSHVIHLKVNRQYQKRLMDNEDN